MHIGTAIFDGTSSTGGGGGGVGSSIVGNYNVPTHDILNGGDNITFPAKTKHSVAVTVISGAGTIDVGDGAKPITAGESLLWTASTLLEYDITITCPSGKIVVTTIGPPAAV
jgi:hypothetical protein